MGSDDLGQIARRAVLLVIQSLPTAYTIMSAAPRYIPPYTLEDYQYWKGDLELIDGVPISMSLSPFGPHERVITELSRQFANQVIENECPYRV